MKKLTIILFGLMLIGFLSGCSNTQEVTLLQEQNRLLQQQVEQKNQELEEINTYKSYETTPVETPPPVVEERPTYTPPVYEPTRTSCCKICSKGKACGDSCISRSYTCHKGPGCACDG